jgi:hypothetical protein
MRDPLANVLEMAELLGYTDAQFFKDWSLGVLLGLSVTDAPAPICFAPDDRMYTIFSLLLHEGLITATPDAKNFPGILGQLTYQLTAAGEYIVEEYVASTRTLH